LFDSLETAGAHCNMDEHVVALTTTGVSPRDTPRKIVTNELRGNGPKSQPYSPQRRASRQFLWEGASGSLQDGTNRLFSEDRRGQQYRQRYEMGAQYASLEIPSSAIINPASMPMATEQPPKSEPKVAM
jgi:hypothetical protein